MIEYIIDRIIINIGGIIKAITLPKNLRHFLEFSFHYQANFLKVLDKISRKMIFYEIKSKNITHEILITFTFPFFLRNVF